MDIALTPALERLISAKLASGQYETASEVVRERCGSSRIAIGRVSSFVPTSRRALTSWLGGEGPTYKSTGRQLAERIKSRSRPARAKKS